MILWYVPLISDDILSRGEPSAAPQSQSGERRERERGMPSCLSLLAAERGRAAREGAPPRGHNPTKLRVEFTLKQNSHNDLMLRQPT